MFSGPGNKTRLLRRPPNVWISCDIQMACVNWKFTGATFDSLQSTRRAVSRSWKHGYSCLNFVTVVYRNWDISYLLPVNGHHLQFPTYPDNRQKDFRVAQHRKHGYFVPNTWDIWLEFCSHHDSLQGNIDKPCSFYYRRGLSWLSCDCILHYVVCPLCCCRSVRQLIQLLFIFIAIDCSIFWYLPSSFLARSFEAESIFEIILHRRRVLTQR